MKVTKIKVNISYFSVLIFFDYKIQADKDKM